MVNLCKSYGNSEVYIDNSLTDEAIEAELNDNAGGSNLGVGMMGILEMLGMMEMMGMMSWSLILKTMKTVTLRTLYTSMRMTLKN